MKSTNHYADIIDLSTEVKPFLSRQAFSEHLAAIVELAQQEAFRAGAETMRRDVANWMGVRQHRW